MQLNVVDAGFVRARRRDIHAVLEDVAAYPHWWSAVGVVPNGEDRFRVRFDPSGLFLPAHEVALTITKNRHERHLGIDFRYDGDLRGDAEWYYLDEATGTVVHYALRAEADDRHARRLIIGHRRCVRLALNVLKDRLEAARETGAEPDERLLSDQRDAIADFAAGVRAHERRTEVQQRERG